MKRTSLFLLILLSTSVFAQEINKPAPFSKFHFGLFAGAGITSNPKTGFSVLLEGKGNILPRLNVRISLGYSSLRQESCEFVKTYRSYNFNNMIYYQTHSYNIESYDYAIFPISAGLEYYFLEGGLSPYIMFEGGDNVYSVSLNCTNNVYGALGQYTSASDVPVEYKNTPPSGPGQRSYRLAFGLGTKVELFKNLNLDVRYLYNINTTLINSHQLLVGVSI